MDELVNALTTGTPHDQVLMQALRDQRGERLPAGTEAAVEAALRRVEGSEDPAAQRIVTGAKLLRRRIKRDRRR
jgi:hypothetical protein